MNEPSVMELNSIAQQWLVEPQTSVDVFSAGPMVPVASEPSWLSSLAKPWVSFGTSLGEAAASTYEDLPARLFDWGMDKLGGSEKRTVPQGPGVTTTYIQPVQAGGAPADPNYIVLPAGMQQGGIVPVQAAGFSMSTIALIGIGLVIWMAVKK